MIIFMFIIKVILILLAGFGVTAIAGGTLLGGIINLSFGFEAEKRGKASLVAMVITTVVAVFTFRYSYMESLNRYPDNPFLTLSDVGLSLLTILIIAGSVSAFFICRRVKFLREITGLAS